MYYYENIFVGFELHCILNVTQIMNNIYTQINKYVQCTNSDDGSVFTGKLWKRLIDTF